MRCPYCSGELGLRKVRTHPKANKKTLFKPETAAPQEVDRSTVLRELQEIEEQRPADSLDFWKPFYVKP
jgi:hypothetical protein